MGDIYIYIYIYPKKLQFAAYGQFVLVYVNFLRYSFPLYFLYFFPKSSFQDTVPTLDVLVERTNEGSQAI